MPKRVGIPVPLKSFYKAFLVVCPICKAAVFDDDTSKHERWHERVADDGRES